MFIGNGHWNIAGFDGEDTYFGYAVLNGDLERAKCGILLIQDLKKFELMVGVGLASQIEIIRIDTNLLYSV